MDALTIFKAWCDITIKYKNELIKCWYGRSHKTALIQNNIYQELAAKLKYRYYSEYYNIDAVFYNEEDLVPSIPQNTT